MPYNGNIITNNMGTRSITIQAMGTDRVKAQIDRRTENIDRTQVGPVGYGGAGT